MVGMVVCFYCHAGVEGGCLKRQSMRLEQVVDSFQVPLTHGTSRDRIVTASASIRGPRRHSRQAAYSWLEARSADATIQSTCI